MFTFVKPRHDGYLRLSTVEWSEYLQLLDIFARRPGTRLTYDRGELEIITPTFQHHCLAEFLNHLVVVLTEEHSLPLQWGGRVTMRRRRLRRGLEADGTYWMAHEAAVRGIKELDLRIHPPPDLAVLVEVSRGWLSRLRVLARLGVPEVWQLSVRGLRFHQLQADGSYAEVTHSPTFPRIAAADIEPFVARSEESESNALTAEFRQWVRQRLAAPAP